MISNYFESCGVCEIMWENVLGPDRPQVTVWRVRINGLAYMYSTGNSHQTVIVSHAPLVHVFLCCTVVLW